jgi:hypothetical protein
MSSQSRPAVEVAADVFRGGVKKTLSARVMWIQPFAAWVRAEVEVSSFPSARFYDNRIFMKKSINDNRKIGRGRPATGTAPLVGVRMTEEFQDQIRAWAKRQEDDPPLAAAIRRLVELGLSGKTK